MSLFISLRSELLKTRRTSSLYFCIIAAAIIPLIFFLELCTDAGAITRVSKDAWNITFVKGMETIGLVILPMYVILACTLVPQIEYRNNTWKQVLASPQSLVSILVTKFLVIHLLILLFLIAFNLFWVSSMVCMQLMKPNLQLFQNSLNWNKFMNLNTRSYISILGISAVQFWFGTRFKNFIAPIGIGFALYFVAGMLLFEFKWPYADLFPFSYPMRTAVFPVAKSSASFIGWSSLGYAVLFFGLALVDFKTRKVKG